MSKRIFVMAVIFVSIMFYYAAAQKSEAAETTTDYYLLLVVEGSSPSSKGWAEPIILTHIKSEKMVIADSLDCNKLYKVNGQPVKMGDVYSIGGEKLVMRVISENFGLGLSLYAKTTYTGLGAVANIMGGKLDTNAMIIASKSNDRSTIRREQLKFMAAMANGVHQMSLERVFNLIGAGFKYFNTNISLSEAYQLASDIMGGTFIPHDGRDLSIRL